jgi:hypothetical protein
MPTDSHQNPAPDPGRRPHPTSPAPSSEDAPYAKPVPQRSRAVIIPGVLLILVGLLDLLSALGFVGGGYSLLYGDQNQLRFLEPKHEEGRPVGKNAWSATDYQFYAVFVCFGLGVLTAIGAIFVLIGGSAMLRSRGWFGAVLASLLAIISPGGVCLLGLIAGIWALAVLFNPNVRQTFH